MLFAMLQHYHNLSRAVINDTNPKLITLYQVIKKSPMALIKMLSELEESYMGLQDEKARKEYYLNVRERFNQVELTGVETSAYFVFLNKTCFNGLYRVNSKGCFNVPFGRYKNPAICDAQTIFADSKLLQRVEILCGDFEQTLSCHSRHSFFYFDPPYRPIGKTSNFTSYSISGFNDDDQLRLQHFAVKLDRLDALWLLSNSDGNRLNPYDTFFDDLYSAYSIKRVWASRNLNSDASKRGKLTELLINNYQSYEQACELPLLQLNLFHQNWQAHEYIPRNI